MPLIIGQYESSTQTIPHLLEQINLPTSAIDKYPDNLSGGQAQRASILRGIIKQSPILIADEPTSSLDIRNSKEVLAKLKNEKASKNNELFIWVTHDIHLIAQFANHIIFLSDGKVVKDEHNNGILKKPWYG